MLKTVNGCVDCDLPCIGSACPYRYEVVMYCDRCLEDVDELFEVDGEDLCEDCLKKEFRKEVWT